jgi:bacterial/archaeal transporter family-2 protein
MDRTVLATLTTAIAGALVALQPPLNATLSDSVGSLPAAAVNFVVGTACLVTLALIFGGGFGDLRSAGLPWYYLVGGGLVGAAYVTTVLITVQSLGAGGVTAATVAGQLTASILIDRAGILGLAERAITPGRILGVAFLALGVILVVRH